MIRYYFRGIEVPREGAQKAWRASKTYKNAKFADEIFSNAEHGRDEGGVTAHLREAKIRIVIDQPTPSGKDGGVG